MGGRSDKNEFGAVAENLICLAELMNLRRALNVDVEDDVDSLCDAVDDFGFECSVIISVDFCVFDEVSGFDFLPEIFAGEEMVIDAVLFVSARRARGARDGERNVGMAFQDFFADAGFSGSAGTGKDESDSKTLDIIHIQKNSGLRPENSGLRKM